MAGWREFRSRSGGVRFDVLERRFLRIRDRSGDTAEARCYRVIDLWTLRELQPEWRPKRGTGETFPATVPSTRAG